MNFKFYPMRALLLALLLLGFKARTQAQAVLDFVKSVENITTGGDGTTASRGNILEYTITVKNLTSSNFVASKLYDNVPAGVTYVTGSTTLNGAAVADATGGVMPYAGSGKYINSPTYGSGILAPNVTATIIFRVKVSANGGVVFNNATIDATQGTVSQIQATNTVYTTVTVDAACNVVYEVTPQSSTTVIGSVINYIRTVNTSNGQGNTTPLVVGGGAGYTYQRDAVTRNIIKHVGDPGGGSKVDLLNYCAAIAYDRDSNRIYFVENNTGSPPLCYYDLNKDTIFRFTNIPLEPNSGLYINRMGMGSDGYCYALTTDASDLIRFKMLPGNTPSITNLGSLIAAPTNGGKNVFTDGGGDLFADGNGKLYLIANSGNMYKVNPTTLVATYMGTVTPYPGGSTAALAIDANGVVYIGGTYFDKYTINLQTMSTTKIDPTSTNVWQTGDFASCGFPALTSSIVANKSYKNINGTNVVNGGDTVVYTITVTNLGNINAAGVYMYDYIPPATAYIAGTTKMNGVAQTDAAGGVMPFSVTGGALVNTLGEQGGIVKPTAANAAVITFNVKTQPNVQVCNQSKISLLDADGNVMFVNSSDPTNVGQTPTCFYSDGVLPLTNLKFKGSLKENNSLLEWSMNGDDNVASYEIEYSETGTAFSTIGNVPGKGNTGAANSYQYTDAAHTFSTVRYYRLKAVQKGGSFTYSGIIRLDANDLDVEVAPNPFDKDINVQVRLKTAEQVRIRLVDFYGRIVYNSTEQLSIGSHSLSIRIPMGLAKGMYVLEVKAGSETLFSKKLLKK